MFAICATFIDVYKRQASNGASAARSSMEQAVEKGKTAVSTAVKGLANAAKRNAHVLVIVGVFLLLILMAVSYTHLDVYKRQAPMSSQIRKAVSWSSAGTPS